MSKFNLTKMLALLVPGMVSAQTNLLPTGDLEGARTGFALWIKSDEGATGAATIAYNSAGAHSGSIGASIQVTDTSAENWHVQYQLPTTWTSQANKIYRLSFWAKGPASVHVGISNQAYAYLTGFTHNLTSSWQRFSGTFTSDGTMRRINIYLAGAVGDYAFDDISITEEATIDPNWYASAEQRIDSLRKKDFRVRVLDASANPIAGASVQVKLLQHAFPFGTALSFGAASADETWYREQAAKYFWAGVLENDFKWAGFEPTSGVVNNAKVNAYLDWAESKEWVLMRGHALEWGIEQYGFDSHWPRLGTCVEYQAALKTRIERDMNTFKGRFHQYDVWNEAFHEPAIFDRCGWALLDSAHVWARRADPTAKLFVNEYSIVAGGETDRMIELVQGMLDRGVPVDGIGAQCHFFSQIIDPSLVGIRLDALARLGLPIVITEFDIGSMNDGMTLTTLEQAAEFAKFIRSAYSHPAVEGIILWGFWDNRHWIANGGILEEDKSAKPAADSLFALWNTHWTTQATGNTSATGALDYRGFAGKYQVTVTTGQTTVVDTLAFSVQQPVWDIVPSTGNTTPMLLPKTKGLSLSAKLGQKLFDLMGRKVEKY